MANTKIYEWLGYKTSSISILPKNMGKNKIAKNNKAKNNKAKITPLIPVDLPVPGV